MMLRNLVFLTVFGAGFPSLAAPPVSFKSSFVFYGDNTEFFHPHRTGETILGQQGKGWFEAGAGPSGTLRLGAFYDFRSATDPQVIVKPLLSAEYRLGGARFLLGALEKPGRHGFLEPLCVSTLEFTRPVEYGLQWLQKDDHFEMDLFMNWHELNTPARPETLDYGFVMKRALDGRLWLEAQLHGYHEGGQLFSVAFRNNWGPALGFRWKAPLDKVGDLRLDAFGVMSGDLGSPVVADTKWGSGAYFRAGFQPHWLPELFVIGWWARDFYFKEGDNNYSSFNASQTFYRQDRSYLEVGLGGTLPLEGGILFNSEMRFHFVDEYFAFSSRHAFTLPFDLEVFPAQPEAPAGKASRKPGPSPVKEPRHESHRP